MSFSQKFRYLLIGLLMAGALSSVSFAQAPSTGLPKETKEQRDQRMAWWREARFGLFIHWGLYASPAGTWNGQQMPEIGEWIMSKYRIPILEYSKLGESFNPVKFDADQWVQIAQQAGMRYVMITAKHHDGFAMFHSQNDPYNIVDATPFHRDPVAELAAACKKHGMKFGFYYSQSLDWHERDAGGTEPGMDPNVGGMSWGNDWDFPDHASKGFDRYFEKKVKPQLQELLTNYGPIAMIWFDCPFTLSRAQSEELYRLARSLQPQCIMNSRLGNGLGDYTSQGDNVIPGEESVHDWETPATLNDTWGYKSFDHNWKSPETLIRNLIDIASKGGNYLLNVGPTAEGLIPQPSVERLAEVGRWMAVNGSAIYGSSASLFKQPLSWGRCTQKPGKLYLHVFDWPKAELVVPELKNRVTKAYLLSDAVQSALPVAATADGVSIKLPAAAPDKIASVVVLEIEEGTKQLPQDVATRPAPPRPPECYLKRHQRLNDRVRKGNVDLIFIGDSITEGWEGIDDSSTYHFEGGGKEVWAKFYGHRNAVNLGVGGDQTSHVLWRLDHGNIDGISPKLAIVMIGTNNSNQDRQSSEQIAAGVNAILGRLRTKLPQTKILLLAIFPCGVDNNDEIRQINTKANAILAKSADNQDVFFLDIGEKFLKPDGTLGKDIMPDLLHPSAKGYAIWAEAIEPSVKEFMGE